MRRISRLAALTIALFCGAPGLQAKERSPEPVSGFGPGCVSSSDWRISAQLDPSVRADRIRCIDLPNGEHALAVTVRPGDAYDPNPGSIPTERAEIQLQRRLVRFDATSWYSFRFRVGADWPTRRNRTVIHQIKQNIDPRYEKGRGGEDICDPANPLFKIEIDSDGDGPIFRAKTAGTLACGDSVGQQRLCGDWPVVPGRWHRVHVMIHPGSAGRDSELRLWLDGRACPTYRGVLGYPRYGVMQDGRPVIDTQPRFGLYRDAIPATAQTILFEGLQFWTEDPGQNPLWRDIDREMAP